MAVVDLAARVVALPCWRGKPEVEPLAGGLSNAAFVVRDGTDRYVARCGSDIPVHHVSRERELAASIAAHAAGLSPDVVYSAPGVIAHAAEYVARMEATLARYTERHGALAVASGPLLSQGRA